MKQIKRAKLVKIEHNRFHFEYLSGNIVILKWENTTFIKAKDNQYKNGDKVEFLSNDPNNPEHFSYMYGTMHDVKNNLIKYTINCETYVKPIPSNQIIDYHIVVNPMCEIEIPLPEYNRNYEYHQEPVTVKCNPENTSKDQYIAYSPNGKTNPKVIHYSLNTVITECARLSKKYQTTFFPAKLLQPITNI